jgi:hypothetical protein
MTAPAAHCQVGRRPSVSLEAQPLEKLLFDENFVVARGQIAWYPGKVNGLENVTVDLVDRMVISDLRDVGRFVAHHCRRPLGVRDLTSRTISSL